MESITNTDRGRNSRYGNRFHGKSGSKVSDKLGFTVTVTADATCTAKWNTAETN